MITKQLIDPQSIVVIGASNNLQKPGGKLFYNIRSGSFKGALYAMNPKEENVQGERSYRELSELPECELAILAIPAGLCEEVVAYLVTKKNTRAFIIISAGFSEESNSGAEIERRISKICNHHKAALIGPNCIGVMTPFYQGVFTLPIPKLDQAGCDFISGSGATAVFIMESGLQKGLKFNTVFSVGNSGQNGVEDVLEYMDETYEEGVSPKSKILYFESIKNPQKLLKHASSLIRKGCRIAAIKAGTSEAGSRAASSHTGALATSDQAVTALFRKAGIIRCYGREELATVAAVLSYPQFHGKNFAIITHAGGPAVMLTDELTNGGLEVPQLKGLYAKELLSVLYAGSSASNPIDILATGTAEHVRLSLEYCEKRFDEIDGIVLIYGTPGLSPVFDVYDVVHQHMLTAVKPVFPVLPSVTTARDEVAHFIAYGRVNFPDEVLLGKALVKVSAIPPPAEKESEIKGIDMQKVRTLLQHASSGYLSPDLVQGLLDVAGITRVQEMIVTDEAELEGTAESAGYPLVMKVVGPVHKTDVGGVVLNIRNHKELVEAFHRMQKIGGYQAVMIQPMLKGLELFVGATFESGFGHVVMCGLGGIYIEALKDFSFGLAPLSGHEAIEMISSLRSYSLLQGVRGEAGINIEKYADTIIRLSTLLQHCPEIREVDLNPLMAFGKQILVVDARIRIEK